MSVERVLIENYKSHRKTAIRLGGLTVLVGPNGCGKTSVLEAIDFVLGLPDRYAHEVFNPKGIPAVVAAGYRDAAPQVSFGLQSDTPLPWSLTYSSENPDGVFHSKVTWRFGGREGSSNGSDKAQYVRDVLGTSSKSWRAAVPGHIFLRLDATKLAEPSTLEVAESLPVLHADGSGLAAVLGWLKLVDTARYEAIAADICRIVPIVEGIRLLPTKFEQTRVYWSGPDDDPTPDERKVTLNGLEVVFDLRGSKGVSARSVSEGTLITLGILTAVRRQVGDEVLLLDGIDHGLHPRAQRMLVKTLYEIARTRPGAQIVATSHSPYLIDELRPEDVCVMATREDGTSASRPLSDHPDAKRALEVLSTGEFLSSKEGGGVVEASGEWTTTTSV